MGGENKQSISSKEFSVEKIQSRVLFGLELFQVHFKSLMLIKGTDRRRETIVVWGWVCHGGLLHSFLVSLLGPNSL